MTSQWRHRNKTHRCYSELNYAQNLYFGFFIFWKLTELSRFVTYLWNDPRNIIKLLIWCAHVSTTVSYWRSEFFVLNEKNVTQQNRRIVLRRTKRDARNRWNRTSRQWLPATSYHTQSVSGACTAVPPCGRCTTVYTVVILHDRNWQAGKITG